MKKSSTCCRKCNFGGRPMAMGEIARAHIDQHLCESHSWTPPKLSQWIRNRWHSCCLSHLSCPSGLDIQTICALFTPVYYNNQLSISVRLKRQDDFGSVTDKATKLNSNASCSLLLMIINWSIMTFSTQQLSYWLTYSTVIPALAAAPTTTNSTVRDPTI